MSRRAFQERYLSFLLLTMAWSWGFLSIAIFAQGNGWQGVVMPCRLLAGVGPTFATIVMLLSGSTADRSDFLRRLTGFDTIRAKWLALILLIVPALTLCSIAIDIAAGGSGGELEPGLMGSLSSPFSLAGFLVFTLLFGPVPEEIGWRGYGVWKAQQVRSPVVTGAIIGFAWMAWHIPLFFIDGTYQAGLGLGTARSFGYLLAILFQSFIMVWIYNNTSGSVPAAVLFHFMVNLVGEVVSLGLMADLTLATLWGVVALLVILRYRLAGVEKEAGHDQRVKAVR